MSTFNISIIIPCYNSANTVLDTFSSIKCQSASSLMTEIIFVDDGSTDDTSKIINRIIDQNDLNNFFIKLIRLNKNRGVSNARNVGISQAKGDWIYFLDSDDCLNKEALLTFGKLIHSFNSYSLIAFSYFLKKGTQLISYKNGNLCDKTINGTSFSKLLLSKKINLHISSIVLNRKFLVNNKITFISDQPIAEDLQFVIHCLFLSKKCYYSSFHCFTYQTDNSTAMHGYTKFTLEMAQSVNFLYQFFLNNGNYVGTDFCNFYTVIFFVYNLKLLFKSNSYSIKAVKFLLKHLFILHLNISPLNRKYYFILKIAQILPVKSYLRFLIWRSHFEQKD
ncbi:glycosyltransferase family 2 protein [Limosilactobacillus fermentum]